LSPANNVGIKQLKLTHSVPTVKLRLAAIRHLFDWLVTGHVMQTNPALSVRGPNRLEHDFRGETEAGPRRTMVLR
jgi:site-specific recombinase XerC